MKNNYAIIGMAHVAEDYPLYYDAMNEKGVAMAGLNFVGNAVYSEVQPDVENIAQFEFIPWILSQFFHILGSVDQQRGCCEVTDGKYEITWYTSCCNVIKGIYYYNTYENHQISAVDMHAEDLESNKLICYPVIQGERINYQNK